MAEELNKKYIKQWSERNPETGEVTIYYLYDEEAHNAIQDILRRLEALESGIIIPPQPSQEGLQIEIYDLSDNLIENVEYFSIDDNNNVIAYYEEVTNN